jgi:DNA-binding transcriptional LysR family regulator
MENLRRLRAFVAVCDCGSAARAAGRLHMSQPAVSAAIAALERWAEVPLFMRGNRGMTPTAVGERLAHRIRAALQHVDGTAALLLGDGPAAMRWQRTVTAVQLKALRALAETRGMSSAARALGISEPSVHRAMRGLEASVGLSLWRWAGSSLELSREALPLARAANLHAGELRMGFEEVRELRGELDGRILVGALPMPRSTWLPAALTATLREFPRARIEVMDGPYENQLSALRDGRIDALLGALRLPGPGSDITQEALFEDPLSIVVRARHPLTAPAACPSGKPTSAQLRSLSWLLPPRPTPARQVFEQFMAAQGAGPAQCAVECNSLVTIRAMLLQSDYAALISAKQIEFERQVGKLRVLGPPIPGTAHPIGLAMRRNFRPTSLFSRFLANVRRHAAVFVDPAQTN